MGGGKAESLQPGLRKRLAVLRREMQLDRGQQSGHTSLHAIETGIRATATGNRSTKTTNGAAVRAETAATAKATREANGHNLVSPLV